MNSPSQKTDDEIQQNTEMCVNGGEWGQVGACSHSYVCAWGWWMYAHIHTCVWMGVCAGGCTDACMHVLVCMVVGELMVTHKHVFYENR